MISIDIYFANLFNYCLISPENAVS